MAENLTIPDVGDFCATRKIESLGYAGAVALEWLAYEHHSLIEALGGLVAVGVVEAVDWVDRRYHNHDTIL